MGQVARQKGRLSHAPDVQSVARLNGRCNNPKQSEGLAATQSGSPGLRSQDARPSGHHDPCEVEVPDVAKSTWGIPPSNSGSEVSGVNITPPSIAAPVPSTPSVA